MVFRFKMRVKNYEHGYVVILERYWKNYRQNAYIERWCATKEEAQYVKDSLEKADGLPYLVIGVEENDIN